MNIIGYSHIRNLRSVSRKWIGKHHIKEQGQLLIVNLPTTKTKKPRIFVISEEFVEIVKKYKALRPSAMVTNRFFINYTKGKCTKQVIGRNKIALMPRIIANFLNLDNPELYTGHSFRRTSATLLADSGANITTLKRHECCWRLHRGIGSE